MVNIPQKMVIFLGDGLLLCDHVLPTLMSYKIMFILGSRDINIYIYTLWLFNIAVENGPFIDDFPS